MNYAKRVSAVFLPCLLATFCIAALGATSAQAEGNWLLEGTSIKESMGFEGEKDSASYQFLVPKLNLELVFTEFSIDKGVLGTGGEGTEELLFTKGQVYQISPLELMPCGVGNLTFKVKTKLFLHKGKTYDLLSPAENGILTETTYWDEGGGCPLGKKNNVTGSLVLEDPKVGFEEGAVTHLVQQAPAALFPEHAMLFGTNSMTLDGSWTMMLNGKNKGLKWSGIG